MKLPRASHAGQQIKVIESQRRQRRSAERRSGKRRALQMPGYSGQPDRRARQASLLGRPRSHAMSARLPLQCCRSFLACIDASLGNQHRFGRHRPQPVNRRDRRAIRPQTLVRIGIHAYAVTQRTDAEWKAILVAI